MSKCKICGDIMTDEAYAMNNGMCELCLRSSQGEDDPLVARQYDDLNEKFEQSALERLAEINRTKGFDPVAFEGRFIQEYRFPKFITSSIVPSIGSRRGEALLLTTHQPYSKDDIVKHVIRGLFLLPFIVIGIMSVLFVIYMMQGGRVEGVIENSKPIPYVAIFSFIWNYVTIFMTVSYVKTLYEYDWVLLKENWIECARGHRFDSKEAERYDFNDLDIQVNKSIANASRYYVEFKHKSDAADKSKFGFNMKVESETEGKYWVNLIKWYSETHSSAKRGFGTRG